MMIVPRVIFPYALLLLPLIPLAIYAGMHMRTLARGRKAVVIALRVVILLCLILALAGLEIVRQNDKLAVFFLLDQSSSIPEQVRLAAADAVRQSAKVYMEEDDEAGVIVFAEEASIEMAMGGSLELGNIQSDVGGEQSDLAAALRLAIAAFPQGFMKRIVVYTDGNETRGAALEEVKLAQAAGVQVDVVPLMIEGGNEVRIREVATPNTIDADEPFNVEVVVRADQDTEAVLRIAQRTQSGSRLLPEQRVTLQKGDNVFLLPQEIADSGFYEYEVSVEAEDDTVLANNEGRGYAVVFGEPRVLYVESDPQNSTYLAPALVNAGLNVTTISPAAMPSSLAQLQNFDAVVLSDVSGTDLSTDQMRAVEAMVRDLGIGLVMIGGPESYGAGGLHESPIERALPLNMDLKQRKILPRGALVLVLHTCEIPDGNAWSREIGLAALNVLASQDLMGALAYTYAGQDQWLFELQPTGDKVMMRQAIARTDIGDMPAVGPTMQMAYNALVNADAAAKRAVVISDGDPAAPSRRLLDQMVQAKITVSTVCIAPHSPSDQRMLQDIAETTGGNYYFVNNANNLPQIFSKEAAIVKRGLLIEKPFVPVITAQTELVRGFIESGLPELRGYVATSAKDAATVTVMSDEQDPILAEWRYGLGKSVAFTSDVTTRWATDWVGWQGFEPFWAQSVRWAMREVQHSGFRVDTGVEDGKGVVRIDAVDSDGNFINGLRPKAVVTGPGPDFARSEVSFMQTAPGIYEAAFPADDRGVYMMNIVYEDADGNSGMVPAGLAVGYSREYEYNTTNRGLLEQVASFGGGAVVSSLDNPFVNDLPSAPRVTPIWHWLVMLALCLFPIEIFIRRVMIDFGLVLAPAAALLRAVPGLKRIAPAKRKAAPRRTGSYGGSAARQFAFAPAAESAFDRTDAPAGSADAAVRAAPPVEAPKAVPEPAGSSDYTRQLLAAKERALKKKQPRNDDKPGD